MTPTRSRLLAGMTAFGASFATKLPAQAADRDIVLGGATNESVGTLFYANDLGMFQRQGLNAKLEVMTNPAPMMGAVISGAISIAGVPISQAALARAQGIPIVLIAPASLYKSSVLTNALIALKDSPIARATDLNGKTIATRDLANMSYLGARAWIDKNGGDSKSVHWLEIPDSQHIAALQAGRVDAASIGEPAFDDALHGGLAKIIGRAFDAIAPQFLVAAYYTTESFARSNADLVTHFAAVIGEASRWANQKNNHARSARILANHGMAAPSADSTRVVYGESLSSADMQPVLDALHAYAFLKEPMRAAELFPQA